MFLTLMIAVTSIVLKPSPEAVFYVIVFVTMPALGALYRLSHSLSSAQAVLEDLKSLAEAVRDRQPDKSGLLSAAASGQADQQPVLTAIRALAVDSSSEFRAADYCFGQAVAECIGAQPAWRTALVLLGLFGTVFFFAFSLTDGATVDLADPEFLRHLGGSLVSTLSGIASSGTLLVIGTLLLEAFEQASLDAEDFFTFAVGPVLAHRPDVVEAGSEVELWGALQQDVRRMTDEIVDRFGTLVDQRLDHVRSLDRIAEELASLPELRVPPALDRLETTIERFSDSAQVIDNSVRVLVEAVSVIDALAPAVAVDELARLRAKIDGLAERGDGILEQLGTAAEQMDQRLDRLGSVAEEIPGTVREAFEPYVAEWRRHSAEVTGELRSGMGDLKSATQGLAKKVEAFEASQAAASRSTNDLTTALARETEAVGALGERVSGLSSRLDQVEATAKSALDRLADDSDSLRDTITGLSKELDQAAQGLAGVHDTLGDIRSLIFSADMATGTAEGRLEILRAMKDLSQRVSAHENSVRRAVAALRTVTHLEAWLERAEKAPLMRLLTMPLYDPNRLPFTRKGTR
ncbi:MAG: hypothetical protein RH859_09440 [Longimicrobiales bacterium]